MAAALTKMCPACKERYEGGEVFCPTDGGRLISVSQIDGLSAVPDDPLVGTILDQRYRVKKRIGEGGMGIVYAGQHVVIDKRVAIKVLRDDFSRRTDVVERFRQEARSASRIENEHIVDISDFGETPFGHSYFVMEFLEGEDVSRVLSRETTLKPERAVRIALQCCDALGAAHAAGIVHRDMKPENVFLIKRTSQEDFVKIVDFGIAKMNEIETDGAPGRKLTKTGMIFGTPEYMSPEQASGKELDHRVDVYAMGVILYECLTGRVPFVGDTFMGILTQQMFEPPAPMATVNANVVCSPELEAVVMQALSKKPEERFQTVGDLANALRKAMGSSTERVSVAGTFVGYGEPVQPAEQTQRARETEPVRASSFPAPARHVNKGIWIGLGVVAAVAVVGAVGVSMMSDGKAAGDKAPSGHTPPPTTQDVATDKPPPTTNTVAPTGAAAVSNLHFTLVPNDAELLIDSVPQSCSPLLGCDVPVETGKKIRIEVRKSGFKPVDTTYTPPPGNSSPTITLVSVGGPKRKPGNSTNTPGTPGTNTPGKTPPGGPSKDDLHQLPGMK